IIHKHTENEIVSIHAQVTENQLRLAIQKENSEQFEKMEITAKPTFDDTEQEIEEQSEAPKSNESGDESMFSSFFKSIKSSFKN
ncbi:MAG TPA: hypothetical protein DCQ31_17115, partial [Bacteroidales bacterium]|nr:hypothetical protein [Bacteroidales bacterium]